MQLIKWISSRFSQPWFVFVAVVGLLCSATVFAQYFGGGRGGGSRGGFDRSQFPTWENTADFEHDTFTFAPNPNFGGGRACRGGGWANDYPDSDINFSFRLQQLTSMKVDPNGIVLRLTDPRLQDYPFIFMSNIQNMWLDAAESDALRQYLQNGGFLMADDFWTPSAWETCPARNATRTTGRRAPVN